MHYRSLLTLGNFVSSGHFFLILYIITPYLATLVPEGTAALAVSLGAIITLATFPFIPRLVRKHGSRKLAIIFSTLEAFVLLWLALEPTALLAVILVALAVATSPLIAYQLDLLLEAVTENEEETGRVRTTFLVAGSVALVSAPLVVGFLLDSTDEYWKVFTIAALSLIPFIGLMGLSRFPEVKHPTGKQLWLTCLCLLNNHDARAVLVANFVLQFFFHIAPLYIPLYLHTALGWEWSELGWVFALMVLPFLVVEYPVGWLADKKWGDKELMAVGFTITGLSFATLTLVTASTTLAVIATILVMSRIGAAMAEATVEGHFFRRVNETDENSVVVFRMARPLGALTAPIIGTLLLVSGSYGILFITTGLLIAFVGAFAALAVRDVR